MENEIIKFKIKGHESFHIREGWLRKGIKNILKDPQFFSRADAVDLLGVGSNMVKSIRYWLQATGLAKERIVKGSKREQWLTEGFGEIINNKDPYFEDIFTLWLMHYRIASNSELSTTWYLFFNCFNIKEFSKEEMLELMKISLEKFVGNAGYSERTFMDDCNCLIKTYCFDKSSNKNPEENTDCILTELGLLEKKKLVNGKEYFIKKAPSIDRLDKLVVLYVILDNLEQGNSTSIDNILNDSSNAGKIFNLDRNLLNEYLDLLVSENYIDINRTAGLDMVYVSDKITKEHLLEEYYDQL